MKVLFGDNVNVSRESEISANLRHLTDQSFTHDPRERNCNWDCKKKKGNITNRCPSVKRNLVADSVHDHKSILLNAQDSVPLLAAH